MLGGATAISDAGLPRSRITGKKMDPFTVAGSSSSRKASPVSATVVTKDSKKDIRL